MNWLEFIAEAIKALSWPITVVLIIYLLRKPLSELIPLLRKLKYKELELDFGKQIKELSEKATKELPVVEKIDLVTEEVGEHLTEIAQVAPRAAIIEAWIELEKAAIAALEKRSFKATSRELRTPRLLEASLIKAEILDKNKITIFSDLRRLRNAAAHAYEFALEPNTAIEYVDLSIRLIEYLHEY